MKWFLMITTFMCLFMYISMDPMKGSFFLVVGLMCVAPLISLNLHVWYAYYVCLIFLSGVFVILVYFSSLSKFIYLRKPLWLISFMLVFLCSVQFSNLPGGGVSINNFYFDVNLNCFLIIILSLLFFMNFTSYFLSLGVAIRKM